MVVINIFIECEFSEHQVVDNDNESYDLCLLVPHLKTFQHSYGM